GDQIPDSGVRRHGQQITLAPRPQFLAKPRGSAQLIVAGDPGVRQGLAPLVQHLQEQLMPRAEADRRGHAGLLPALLAAGPLLGQLANATHRLTLAASRGTTAACPTAPLGIARTAQPPALL